MAQLTEPSKAEGKAAQPDETPVAAAVIDDARHEAEGVRSAARWIASAIAGIPALTLLATILKPPDGASFEPWTLALGVTITTTATFIGIVQLGRVFEPVSVEDADLTGFKMVRVPEAADASYGALLERFKNDVSFAASAGMLADDAEGVAEGAKATLDTRAEAAKLAEAALLANKTNPELQEQARTARAGVSEAVAEHAQRAAEAAVARRASSSAESRLVKLREHPARGIRDFRWGQTSRPLRPLAVARRLRRHRGGDWNRSCSGLFTDRRHRLLEWSGGHHVVDAESQRKGQEGNLWLEGFVDRDGHSPAADGRRRSADHHHPANRHLSFQEAGNQP
jgi:hypothetical protein